MRLLRVLILLSVSCTSQSQKEKKISEIQNEVYLDSLFHKNDAVEFNSSDINKILSNGPISLRGVSDSLKERLSKCSDIGSQILDSYYYKNYTQLASTQVSVFLVSTLSSNFFVMVIFSDDLDIVSCIRLTEDYCDLIYQNDFQEEVWCDTKKAYLAQSLKLKIVREHIKKIDDGMHLTIKKDSITTIYRITDEGNLKKLRTDSVRVER